ncbi:MAG: amino acid-binding protein [Oscillospiraceae bacterium]|nr:amino acid-binding protein [Oscillospiraceae bacterium]
MIYQISVYTENKKGALRTLVKTLSDAGIDLRAFITNENGEFGTVRMLADDDEGACAALTEAGYLTKRSLVLAVEVSDEVGGLAGLLEVIEEANLNIDYLYAAWDRTTGQPVIVLHTESLAEVESCLVSKGYRSLGRE